jgi:hypothetical protein
MLIGGEPESFPSRGDTAGAVVLGLAGVLLFAAALRLIVRASR